MAVQILTRGILAYRRRRQAAALADPAYLEKQEQEKERQQKAKKKFTVDGRPLSTVVFDPDHPEQSAPYPDEEDTERSCTLCLGTRRDSTATECGHVCEFRFLVLASSPTECCSFRSLLGVRRWMGEGEGESLCHRVYPNQS